MDEELSVDDGLGSETQVDIDSLVVDGGFKDGVHDCGGGRCGEDGRSNDVSD